MNCVRHILAILDLEDSEHSDNLKFMNTDKKSSTDSGKY